MQQHARPQPAQSQVVCGGCRTLLMYPQGAQNVRCARCAHITSAPPPPGSDMAQLSCTNPHCRVALMYPRGALQVQCSLCGTLNDAAQSNQLGHVVCGGCQITLMYAHGAQSVKCAVCNHVTPASAGAAAHAPFQQQPMPPPPGGQGYQPHRQQYHPPHHHHHHHQPPPQQQYQQQQQQQQQQQYHPAQHAPPQQLQPQPSQASTVEGVRPEMQHVLVENPPTLDERGQEVQTVALGMTPKPEPNT